MQNEVTVLQPLLDETGSLSEPGWAKKPVFRYERSAIRANRLRIKEWDYYLIANDRDAIALTIADNSYMGLISASVLNFENGFQHTESVIIPFPLGRFQMPQEADEGITQFENKRVRIRFHSRDGARELRCHFNRFYQNQNLEAEFLIAQPFDDRMVIATPWANDKKAFYYNQKINCMPAAGSYHLGEKQVDFDRTETFATFDWGRGVWTRKNTWYWGSGSSWEEGIRFGFNFGYGFGDPSAASENMLFYDGAASKLNAVTFKPQDPDNLMRPWKILSDDQRVNCEFHPFLDRAAKLNVLILSSDQHQVFGKLSGKIILDSGKTIHLQGMTCFFERVSNIW